MIDHSSKGLYIYIWSLLGQGFITIVLKIKINNGDEGIKQSTLYQMELPLQAIYANGFPPTHSRLTHRHTCISAHD